MAPSSSRRLAPITVPLLMLAGCTSTEPPPPAPPSARITAQSQNLISGTVRGPDGNSACNLFLVGSRLIVRPVPTDPAAPIPPQQTIFCPVDVYAILADSGTYRMRVTLPIDPSIGALPWRWLEPGDVVVAGVDVVKDLTVFDGLPLGGSVTLEGVPLTGGSITLTYGINPGFAAAVGGLGPSGGWEDLQIPRAFLPVQANEVYNAGISCDVLGSTVVSSSPPPGPFLFPTEYGAVDCSLKTALATRYTNLGFRMAVTAFPAEIGGQSGAMLGRLGRGWGAQFPIGSGGPVHTPFNATQVFRAGLILASEPARILTGFDAAGYFECPIACQDLGVDGAATVATMPGVGRVVQWRTGDQYSPEGIGLRVIQQSFDNSDSTDYILYRYAISNVSRLRQTFYAGVFADLDIDLNAGDDEGATDLNGALAYVTNGGGLGTHTGTLLMGSYPVAGNHFIGSGSFPLLAEQYALMSGVGNVPSIPCCSDVRYLQSVGPITINPGATAHFWAAVVMGDDKNQLLANAQAAQQQVSVLSARALPTYTTGLRRYTGTAPLTPAIPLAKPVNLQ